MPSSFLTRLLPLLVLWVATFLSPQAFGRFLSPDPLGHAASWDLYSYAGGDPINSVDVTGAGVQDYMRMAPENDDTQGQWVVGQIGASFDAIGNGIANGLTGGVWGEATGIDFDHRNDADWQAVSQVTSAITMMAGLLSPMGEAGAVEEGALGAAGAAEAGGGEIALAETSELVEAGEVSEGEGAAMLNSWEGEGGALAKAGEEDAAAMEEAGAAGAEESGIAAMKSEGEFAASQASESGAISTASGGGATSSGGMPTGASNYGESGGGGMGGSGSASGAQSARLDQYGGPGGGHHIPAKSAFDGAQGYDLNTAPAVPNEELKRLGVNHQKVTGAQQILYRNFAKNGAPLTWDAMEDIETKALIQGGLSDEGTARATVQNAIQQLKDGGVSGPTRIPWGK